LVYVKSILAGLLALIVVPVCLLVIVVVGMLIYAFVHPTSSFEGSVGWDPISLVRLNPTLWSIPLRMFFIGFIWESRRLAKWH
jgi:hypothetical protein